MELTCWPVVSAMVCTVCPAATPTATWLSARVSPRVVATRPGSSRAGWPGSTSSTSAATRAAPFHAGLPLSKTRCYYGKKIRSLQRPKETQSRLSDATHADQRFFKDRGPTEGLVVSREAAGVERSVGCATRRTGSTPGRLRHGIMTELRCIVRTAIRSSTISRTEYNTEHRKGPVMQTALYQVLRQWQYGGFIPYPCRIVPSIVKRSPGRRW